MRTAAFGHQHIDRAVGQQPRAELRAESLHQPPADADAERGIDVVRDAEVRFAARQAQIAQLWSDRNRQLGVGVQRDRRPVFAARLRAVEPIGDSNVCTAGC